MIDRTRTFRVLACLMLSMTGMTVGLEWVHHAAVVRTPIGGGGHDELPADRTAMQGAGGPVWSKIEFVAVDEGTFAYDAESEPSTHFILDSDGRLKATRLWHERRPLAGLPGVIRIRMEPAADGPPGPQGIETLLSLSRLLPGMRAEATTDDGSGRAWPDLVAVASTAGLRSPR